MLLTLYSCSNKLNVNSPNVPSINNVNYDISTNPDMVINRINFLQKKDFLMPSFAGDGFFLQINDKDYDCLKKDKIIKCHLQIIEKLFGTKLKLKYKTHILKSANVKDIASIICDSDKLTKMDISVCNVLIQESPSQNDISEYQKCEGSDKSTLVMDLGEIKLTVFQQQYDKKNIEEKTIVLVKPSWGNNAYIYGSLFEESKLPKIRVSSSNYQFYNFCEGNNKDSNQSNINQCIYEKFKKYQKGIAFQENSQCMLNDINHEVWLSLGNNNSDKISSIKLHKRYTCPGKYNGVNGEWEVLIDNSGTINKSVPLFAFFNNQNQTNEYCTPPSESTDFLKKAFNFCAWPVNPIQVKPKVDGNIINKHHKYKNILTWDNSDKHIIVPKLKQGGIFKEIELSNRYTTHTVNLQNNHLLHPLEPNKCTYNKQLDAKLINTFTHLDRMRRLTTSIGLCCSGCPKNQNNKCENAQIDFPRSEIETIIETRSPPTGTYNTMKINLGISIDSKSCKTSTDATLISHEFAHILINDIRSQIFSNDSANSINLTLHDLADTISFAYTNEPKFFEWSKVSTERVISSNDNIPSGRSELGGESPYYQDQIFASIYKSWLERSQNKSECKITNNVRSWARLLRTASLHLSVPITCNKKAESCDIYIYRELQRVMMVYLMQMKGASDEYLISDYIGHAYNSGISLLPWQCLINPKSKKSIHCNNETQDNINISVATYPNDLQYIIKYMKIPKLTFDPTGKVEKVTNSSCVLENYQQYDFSYQVSNSTPRNSSTPTRLPNTRCVEEFSIDRSNNEKTIYFLEYNLNMKSNFLPIFGEIKPINIKAID